MTDVIYIVVVLAFFGVCALFARACEKM